MPFSPAQLKTCNATLDRGDAIVADRPMNETGFCLLHRRGFIAINGKDAEKFMQGQLTCDVAKIDFEHSSLGAHCTPKGRAIANFRLVKHADEHYLFSLPADNCDKLQTSLGKYIVFSKARLTEDDRVAIGLCGAKAASWLQNRIPLKQVEHASATNDYGTAICVDAETPRFELWLSAQQLEQLWPQIAAELDAMHPSLWYRHDINQGRVEITAALSDSLIPQMFNLDKHNGISFTKGCYTGQEIIARLKYLGKQKRQLARFKSTAAAAEPGSDLIDAQGHNLGVIVALDITRTEGLAVIAESTFEKSDIGISLTRLD